MDHSKTSDLIEAQREKWKAVTWLSASLQFLKDQNNPREHFKKINKYFCGSSLAHNLAPSVNLCSALPDIQFLVSQKLNPANLDQKWELKMALQ